MHHTSLLLCMFACMDAVRKDLHYRPCMLFQVFEHLLSGPNRKSVKRRKRRMTTKWRDTTTQRYFHSVQLNEREARISQIEAMSTWASDVICSQSLYSNDQSAEACISVPTHTPTEPFVWWPDHTVVSMMFCPFVCRIIELIKTKTNKINELKCDESYLTPIKKT